MLLDAWIYVCEWANYVKYKCREWKERAFRRFQDTRSGSESTKNGVGTGMVTGTGTRIGSFTQMEDGPPETPIFSGQTDWETYCSFSSDLTTPILY